MITLRTTRFADRIEYTVERADDVYWKKTVKFGKTKAHRAGGVAFQQAASEQAFQGNRAAGPGERVEERMERFV